MIRKKCSVCSQYFPANQEYFYRDASMLTGLTSKCKNCKDHQNRQWETNNRERRREIHRKTDKKNANQKAIKLRIYRQEHPLVAKAQGVLNYAIKKARMVRPNIRERCGVAAKNYKLSAHHQDYTKPLDVIFVCGPCHYALGKTSESYPGNFEEEDK